MSQPIRVLLVDDEKIFVQSMVRILQRKGVQVATAGDGRQALQSLAQGEFDVVVLDIKMPQMDGLACLQALRQDDALTPVLILTGHTDLNGVTQALKGGNCEVLLKPCPVDTLLAAIEDAAERKTLARQALPSQD